MPTVSHSVAGGITPTGDVTEFGVGTNDSTMIGELGLTGALANEAGAPDPGDPTKYFFGFSGQLGLAGALTTDTPQGVVAHDSSNCLGSPIYSCNNDDFVSPAYRCYDEESGCGVEVDLFAGFDGALLLGGVVYVQGGELQLAGSLDLSSVLTNIADDGCTFHTQNWSDYANLTAFFSEWSVVYTGTSGNEQLPGGNIFRIVAGFFGSLGGGNQYRYYTKSFCAHAGKHYQIQATRTVNLVNPRGGQGIQIISGASGSTYPAAPPSTTTAINFTFTATANTVVIGVGIYDIQFGENWTMDIGPISITQLD